MADYQPCFFFIADVDFVLFFVDKVTLFIRLS